MIVSEVFGPTVQGEGPSIGQRCGFVRLGRCNLACGFCDTPFTWRWSDHDPAVELHEMSVDEIVGRLDAMSIDMLVISGGEPLLQQRDLRPLVDAVRTERGWRVEVETAGTIAPELDVDQWNVSPKLANSGNPLDRRYKPDVLGRFQATGRAAFKFVVADRGDLEEVADIVEPSRPHQCVAHARRHRRRDDPGAAGLAGPGGGRARLERHDPLAHPHLGGRARPVTTRVILVHGTMDRASSFARLLPHLTDLDVVTYDRRGYGRARRSASRVAFRARR